ncbi:MAG: cob(I)yrinic acid a,c-diamide adenosyltransferase [Verrucomicrobiota bacterium]
MSIATKTGDAGETGLMFGKRVSKNHPRVEANGAVDEFNATLGMARVSATHALTSKWIAEMQADLVTLMGELATLPEDLSKFEEKGFQRVAKEMVDKLDDWVTELEGKHKVNFMKWAVPGAAGSPAGAALDLARTVCRRAERHVASLIEDGDIENVSILQYLNRLSDVCWLLARLEEKDD